MFYSNFSATGQKAHSSSLKISKKPAWHGIKDMVLKNLDMPENLTMGFHNKYGG